MRVLVTGAQGFVGRAVVLALQADGHAPAALGGAVEGAEDAPGDLQDEPSLLRALRGIDGVIHLACTEDPRASTRDAERVNLIATENLLAAARAAGVKRLVHRSSETVTRTRSQRSYVDERLPHTPRFTEPVTETLSLAEDLVTAASGGGIETVCLRPGALWGVGDDAFLPGVLRAVKDGSFTWIDGGASLVATTWFESFARAAVSALTAPDAAGGVFYVTDDERLSRKDFVGGLLRACGAPTPRRSVPFAVAYALAEARHLLGATTGRTVGEVLTEGRSAHFNIQRARAALGYAPAVTVAEGTTRVGEWVRSLGGWEALAAR